MDRVHSKCAHYKHTEILDGIEIGRGGWGWIFGALCLFNWQIFKNEGMHRIFMMVYREVVESITLFSIGAFLTVNIIRWGMVIFISEELSSFVIHGVIWAGIWMEGVLYLYGPGNFMGFIFRYLSLCQLMKGVSYLLNKREIAILGQEDSKIEEPKKEASLFRFIIYPTLCYQEEYPVYPAVSFFMVGIYVLMICPFSVLTYFCLKIKCYESGTAFIEEMSFCTYLDLFMWSNLGWISGFILVFVGFYGLLSDLTKFGDRSFFESWWNADISDYWRKWNTQVYRWIKRHVFRALIKKNITVKSTKIIIFLISGIVHEYVIGNALKARGIGFLTMVSQVPLDIFIRGCSRIVKFDQKLAATIIFNVIGAPLLVVISIIPKKFL